MSKYVTDFEIWFCKPGDFIQLAEAAPKMTTVGVAMYIMSPKIWLILVLCNIFFE